MKFKLFILSLALIFAGTSFAQIKPAMDKSRFHVKKGIDYYQQGELKKAENEFLIALKISKRNFIANEMLAQIYFQENNFKDAMKFAEIALKINPKLNRAYLIMGAVLFESGQKEKAREKIKQALQNAQTKEDREKAFRFLSKYKELMEQKEEPSPFSVPEDKPVATPLSDAAPVSKPYIAVFPFEETNIQTERTQIGETLSEMLTTSLIQTNAYNVMERAQLQKVLKEQSLGQTGVIDSETALEVGKLIGLEAIVIGSVSQLRSVIEGDARMIDVQTGKALTAVNGKVNSIDDMRSLANQLAKQLALKASLVTLKQQSTKTESTQQDKE